MCSGTLRTDRLEPVGPSTSFHAGSIAKSLTGLVVADAARRGELDLDVPCSEQGTGLWDDTPRALLTQTTGRPNALPGQDDLLEGEVRWTCDACIKSWVLPAGEEPTECPNGHKADDTELNTGGVATEDEAE